MDPDKELVTPLSLSLAEIVTIIFISTISVLSLCCVLCICCNSDKSPESEEGPDEPVLHTLKLGNELKQDQYSDRKDVLREMYLRSYELL